jgi:hypothetical protein
MPYLIDRKAIFYLIAACVMAGCADQAAYRTPISTFQDASSVMVHSTRIYLTQLNKVERDAYIRRQAANNQHIRLNEIEKTQSFSPEEIAVRLEALNGLSRLGSCSDNWQIPMPRRKSPPVRPISPTLYRSFRAM